MNQLNVTSIHIHQKCLDHSQRIMMDVQRWQNQQSTHEVVKCKCYVLAILWQYQRNLSLQCLWYIYYWIDDQIKGLLSGVNILPKIYQIAKSFDFFQLTPVKSVMLHSLVTFIRVYSNSTSTQWSRACAADVFHSIEKRGFILLHSPKRFRFPNLFVTPHSAAGRHEMKKTSQGLWMVRQEWP